MAVDALGLSLSTMEEIGEKIPDVSPLGSVDPEDGILAVIHRFYKIG